MSKLPDPRDLVLSKEVSVTCGIHGHNHRKPNRPKKLYFKLYEEEIDWLGQKLQANIGIKLYLQQNIQQVH